MSPFLKDDTNSKFPSVIPIATISELQTDKVTVKTNVHLQLPKNTGEKEE